MKSLVVIIMLAIVAMAACKKEEPTPTVVKTFVLAIPDTIWIGNTMIVKNHVSIGDASFEIDGWDSTGSLRTKVEDFSGTQGSISFTEADRNIFYGPGKTINIHLNVYASSKEISPLYYSCEWNQIDILSMKNDEGKNYKTLHLEFWSKW